MATSRYLLDVFVRHQVYLEGLKTDTIRGFDPLMQELERLIVNALAESGVDELNQLSFTQLDILINRIREIESSVFSDYATQLTNKLENVSEYESSFTEEAIRSAVNGEVILSGGAGIGWLYAKTHPIQATGQLLETFISDWTEKELSAVEALLRNAHAQGWTIDQTIRAIRGTKNRNYTDGLLGKVQRDIETIVRTAIQHVSNAARMAILEANKDIVVGYRWVSVLDTRTTPVCRSLDGRVFKLGEGPTPPLHPNCRSTVIPEMLESIQLRESSTRASSTGPVPSNWNYYEWLLHQPASFQDSVIGEKRGMLLRSGKLSSKQFAELNLGRTFKPRTLEEMRKLRPEVFQ